MYRCVFLTADSTGSYTVDDELVYSPLAQLGWEAEAVSWTHKDTDWQQFDAAIIRSTWDYHHHIEQFVAFLERLSQIGVSVANSIETVKWNAHKSYLLELQKKGIPIVPTVTGTNPSVESIRALFRALGTTDVVIKPSVGASAEHTYRLNEPESTEKLAEISTHFQNRDYLAQPFMPSIVERGEYSLIFFNGEYSHAVLKTPAAQDFRVQEIYGGSAKPITPNPKAIMLAKQAIAVVKALPLYARVDLVRADETSFVLAELELIEPNLYFRANSDSPARFVQAFTDWVRLNNVGR